MRYGEGYPNAGTQVLYGALFLALLLPIGYLTSFIGPVAVIFTWVPLIAIFLWPSGAHEALSILIIFAFGWLFDLFYGSRAGQTALLFLIYFVAINPKNRPRKRNFMTSWGLFALSILIVTVVLHSVASVHVRKFLHFSLLQTGLSAVLVFPFIYGLWWYTRSLLSEIDAFS